MKYVISLIIPFLLQTQSHPVNDSQPDDTQIAKVVRQAVREAPEELLESPLLSGWRDHLKLAAMELNISLQPLVLIKFDEDISFRNHLKQIIEWEKSWGRQETDCYIYYFRPEDQVPDLILEVQDGHFQELTALFGITVPERIPYRYDLLAEKNAVFPFEDLRGGIISPHPFDLEASSQAIFNSINPDMPFITIPLTQIYGAYYKNHSTAEACFKKGFEEIKEQGYTSATELLRYDEIKIGENTEWYSSFIFTFKLSEVYGPQKISNLLTLTNQNDSTDFFLNAFKEVFRTDLHEFEEQQGFLSPIEE